MKRIIAALLAVLLMTSALFVVFASENKGDVNGNGEIDITDYILCKRAYFDTFDLDEVQEARADVNDNDKLDMLDYFLIKRMYFGTYVISGGETDDDDMNSSQAPDDSSDFSELLPDASEDISTPESSDIPEETEAPESSDITESSDVPDISDESETSDESDESDDVVTPVSKVISYDKPYTYSNQLYTNSFQTSLNADICLTDGEKEHVKYYDIQYVGFYSISGETATVTIDLGKEYYTDKFIAYAYGGLDGIELPSSVSVAISSDGTEWVDKGFGVAATKTVFDDWGNTATIASYTIQSEKAELARYVRYSFVAASIFLMMDELEVYGYSTDAIIPDDDDVSDSETSEDTTMKETGEDMLLCYIARTDMDASLTKEEFLPSVGYKVNGEYVDYMYDSFIFLCSPNYLYDWDANGAAYLRPYTKSDWTYYISNYEFRANRNINALDAAVGEVKAALGDKNHKAKVYMTLFYPVENVTNFGEVDGKNLNFDNLQDRYLGMKWMVDESVRQFNAQNYENLELAGFYWFCEELYDESGEGKAIAAYTTDYVRSLGMKTAWCPYFYANGYTSWREMGFDIAAMQANYFPSHRTDWPNKGGPERLPLVARAAKTYGLGVGMELADSKNASCKILKEYMEAGINYDFMNLNHIHYMSEGPEVVKELADSSDSFVRSAYDEMYKFIKGKLTLSDIMW